MVFDMKNIDSTRNVYNIGQWFVAYDASMVDFHVRFKMVIQIFVARNETKGEVCCF